LNVSDADAEKYIKIFTSIDKEEIDNLIAEHAAAPHMRNLQKRLAKEVTCMVHSEEDYNAAVDASNILFGNATSEALRKLDEDTLLAVFDGVPQFKVAKSLFDEGCVKAIDLLVDHAAVFPRKAKCVSSFSRVVCELNKEKLENQDALINYDSLLNGKYLLAQKGKKILLSAYCRVIFPTPKVINKLKMIYTFCR
jgi:tyrosyl-tRNA synthetase